MLKTAKSFFLSLFTEFPAWMKEESEREYLQWFWYQTKAIKKLYDPKTEKKMIWESNNDIEANKS